MVLYITYFVLSLDLAWLLLTPGLLGTKEYGKIGHVCFTKRQSQCIARLKRVPSQPLVTVWGAVHTCEDLPGWLLMAALFLGPRTTSPGF